MHPRVPATNKGFFMHKSLLTFLLLCFFILLTVPPSITAQDPPPNTYGSFDINKVRQAMGDTGLGAVPSAVQKPVSIAFLLARILISLALLTAAVIGLLWILKKSGFSGTSRLGGGASMDVVEVLPLGQNRSIFLVRLTDKILVIAQTPHHTALLDTIEGPRAIEIIAGHAEGPAMAPFKDVFNTFIEKLKKQEPQKLS